MLISIGAPAGSARVESVTLGALLGRIATGRVRTLTFHRGYVWNALDVAALADSLDRELPVGLIVLWRTPRRMRGDRPFQPFRVPQPPARVARDYVLDGYQRLVSLFGLFGPPAPYDGYAAWLDVYGERHGDEAAFGERFFALEPDNVDADRHLTVRSLYERSAARLHGLLERVVPVCVVSTPSPADVALLFERLNRGGVRTEDYDLHRAWRWHEDRPR